jgi:hypothetical protein
MDSVGKELEHNTGYAKIVIRDLVKNRQLGKTLVLPTALASLEYAKLMSSEARGITENFARICLEECQPEEFNINNFELYMKFSMGQISYDEYHSNLE